MTDSAPLDLADIEARHRPFTEHYVYPGEEPRDFIMCGQCYHDFDQQGAATWPCDAAQLVARVRALEAEVAQLRDSLEQLAGHARAVTNEADELKQSMLEAERLLSD